MFAGAGIILILLALVLGFIAKDTHLEYSTPYMVTTGITFLIGAVCLCISAAILAFKYLP